MVFLSMYLVANAKIMRKIGRSVARARRTEAIQMVQTPELKPCPFCGGNAELKSARIYVEDGWFVRCIMCRIRTKVVIINHPSLRGTGELDESTRYTSDQAARIAANTWNRRVGEGA